MCQILTRLKKYMEAKTISTAAFEKSIGMSNGLLGKQLKKNGTIGSDKLEKILINYPDLSPEWLILGAGPMLKSDDLDLARRPVNEISTVPANQSISIESETTETRPRIPFDAAAGILSEAVQSVSSAQCEQVPLIPTFPRYDFTIIARGDSMTPDFLSGDELACAFVSESSFIQWGRVHVLDTAQGIVLKRIFNHNQSILCRSINRDYPDFDIPKDEIYHIAVVVGLIRHF